MSDLPPLYWCEECGEDVDITEDGLCIHCREQIWGYGDDKKDKEASND